jgi:carboxypeptidase PM20D1
MDDRTKRYAETLAQMIRKETISTGCDPADPKFHEFRDLLAEWFPNIFGACEIKGFPDGLVLHWKGTDTAKLPVVFMNHHDVVEATGDWSHDPFSGDIDGEKIWGRGTLDDKGGLWAMFQAADELAAEGFAPSRDVWFSSASTEETTGKGADEISQWFLENGVRFEMCFDEGGMILYDPIGGADGTFAVIGVGEKGCADLKFIARSKGGHASDPPKNTPLVRLGKFMAAVERSSIFETDLSPTVCEMLRRFAPYMGKFEKVLRTPERFAPILKKVVPNMSSAAAAMLRTTVAFTMAQGSGGTNVIPQEAWVVGNMRFSHHQGREASFRAIERIAKRYDIEMEVMDPGYESRISDYNGPAFKLTERAVGEVFPGVVPVPYIMTGASDARYFDRVCDQCIRFLPFEISDEQLSSIHGIDECLDIRTLARAVDYYKFLMMEV